MSDLKPAPRCGATDRVEGEAVHCDLPPGHKGKHRDYIEDARWAS
jgi:hypothetical protein